MRTGTIILGGESGEARVQPHSVSGAPFTNYLINHFENLMGQLQGIGEFELIAIAGAEGKNERFTVSWVRLEEDGDLVKQEAARWMNRLEGSLRAFAFIFATGETTALLIWDGGKWTRHHARRENAPGFLDSDGWTEIDEVSLRYPDLHQRELDMFAAYLDAALDQRHVITSGGYDTEGGAR